MSFRINSAIENLIKIFGKPHKYGDTNASLSVPFRQKLSFINNAAMQPLQIFLFIYTLCVTCFFVIYSFYNNDLSTTIKRTKPINVEAYIDLAKAYPNYYEDDLHGGWPFNITRQYTESDIREWSEPSNLRNKISLGTGEGGAGFIPPDNQKELMAELQKENNYNLLASEMISLHRSLPDPRYNECKNLSYPRRLPTTTVVIIFHNEAWTTLLRTVWSIIDRSPLDLIKEIILVDDLSTWSFLKRPLDDYIETVPVRIKLIRNKKREGLIRARLIGAQHATGQVLTFLDAHIECCEGWLQPILARIANDRSVIAVPLIDTISSTDMSYIHNSATTYINGFRMSLIFNWMPIPERELIRTRKDKTAPVRTPTMIGCAFSIDREFFFEIGSYDEGMDIWGSENMEMSLRVWQCGGSMEILPCSHVAHLYRISTYSFDGNADAIKARNSIRLFEVWMPEIRDILYAVSPSCKKHSGGDVTERIALQQRLKCKDFRWYLANVYPDSCLNNEFIHFGEIKSPAKKRCLDIYGGYAGYPVKTVSCHSQGGSQVFGLTKTQKIVTVQEMCIGVHKKSVVSLNCMKSARWNYDNKTNWLVHVDSQLCMRAAENRKVVLGKCDPDDDTFIWNLVSAI